MSNRGPNRHLYVSCNGDMTNHRGITFKLENTHKNILEHHMKQEKHIKSSQTKKKYISKSHEKAT